MEKIICEKCGHEMKDFSHGPYISIKCPNCGWGWAAYDSELAETKNIETKRLLAIEGDQYTKDRALYLTKVLTGNSILSRQLLKEGGNIEVSRFDLIEPELKRLGIRFNATLLP